MKLDDAFIGVQLLYVETAPFIYYTENRAGFVEKMRAIFQRVIDAHINIVTSTSAARAADLCARYKLRTPDALHVASGLVTGCDVFLTNDLELKSVHEVRIFVLDELDLG